MFFNKSIFVYNSTVTDYLQKLSKTVSDKIKYNMIKHDNGNKIDMKEVVDTWHQD